MTEQEQKVLNAAREWLTERCAQDKAEKALFAAVLRAYPQKAAELEALFGQVKQGRYHSLAMTSLEQSVMWIVKELTS